MSSKTKNLFCERNPLLDGRTVRLVHVWHKESFGRGEVIDSGSGLTELRSRQVIEAGRYYIQYLPDDLLCKLNTLTPLGERAWGRFKMCIRPNQDWIQFSARKLGEMMNVSHQTASLLLKELCLHKFIAPKKAGQYWFSPYYVYVSDRKAYFQRVDPDAIEIVHAKKE